MSFFLKILLFSFLEIRTQLTIQNTNINLIVTYTTYNIHADIYTTYNTYYLHHLQY